MHLRGWIPTLAVAATIGVGAMGCDEGPEQWLSEGKIALAAGEFDRAQAAFDRAVDGDPELIEARRLKATVHIETGQFEIAEQSLQRLWDEQGFDDEGELTVEQRQLQKLFGDQFDALYESWAHEIDRDSSPDEYEAIVTTGLRRNGANGALGSKLVEHYRRRADHFVERGEPERAAEILEKLDEIDHYVDADEGAGRRAERLRRRTFQRHADERFEQQLRPRLVDGGRYDAGDERIVLEAEYVPGGRLDDDRESIRRWRTEAAMSVAEKLLEAIGDLTDTEADIALYDGIELPAVELEDEQVLPRRYEMVVAVQRDDLFDAAFAHQRALEAGRTTPIAEDSSQQKAIVDRLLGLDTAQNNGE